jgi:hypothetical protein
MITGKLKQYGFDPSKVVIKPEAWKFGSNIPLDVLVHDGQWDDYLPTYEAQADVYETWGCTVWGGQNQIEILMNFLFGIEPNYYEGYNYNIAEITPPGGDPDTVCQSFKNYGLIPTMPMPMRYEDFCKPRPMSEGLLLKGKEWLDQYTYRHEWVIPSNPTKMKELIVSTLQYSPVGLSVTAWFKDSKGLYVDMDMPNTHWCVCYGYRYDEQGRVILKIFDSYDQSTKELHPDHFVSFAKRIWIDKKEVAKKRTWWQKLIDWLYGKK